MNSTYLEEYKSLESSIKSKLTGAEKEDGGEQFEFQLLK